MLDLTKREREVAALVAEGLTNREIGRRLSISERTAEGHLEHIRDKLGVGTRTQIATWFLADSREPEVTATHQPIDRWPPQPTVLFGRERELAEVRDLILRPDVRLLTLTGPPGTGKTRLASWVALDLASEFRDGARFVDLSPVFDPSQVISVIAQAIGARSQLGAAIAAIGARRMLLLLDNFEQVLPAAGQVAELVASCPDLKVMITSRECLHLLRWEHEYLVEPLQLPDLDTRPSSESISESPAVALFVDRARARNPRFALSDESAEAVARVCVRLDGLPLAIELAAAGIKFRTPAAILADLQRRGDGMTQGGVDFPERHRSLQQAIAASHALLSEEERVVFRRLGSFVGGFDLEAVEAICAGGEIDPGQTASIMAKLVDKSLVQVVAERRYGFLLTIQQYAEAQLIESGEAKAVHELHCAHFVKLAEVAVDALHSPEESSSFDRLNVELDNFRAVFSRALANRDAEPGLRLGAALADFWGWRGFVAEGCDLLAAFVGMADQAQLERTPAALMELGYLEARRLGPGAARTYFERYLPMARKQNDHRGEALAQIYLGEGLYLGESELENADLGSAQEWLEGALASANQSDFPPMISYALRALAMVAHLRGDDAAGIRLLDEALAMARELGDDRGVALGLLFRGRIAFDRRDYELAAASYAESLHLFSTGGYRWVIPALIERFARLSIVKGKRLVALQLAGVADSLRDVIEANEYPFWRQDFDELMDAAAGGDARRHAEWARGRAMRLDEALNLAQSVWQVAPKRQ